MKSSAVRDLQLSQDFFDLQFQIRNILLNHPPDKIFVGFKIAMH